MEQELKLLEEFLNMEYHNLSCYSRGLNQTEARDGFEKEWNQTKDRIEQIIRIMKVVNAESHALKGENRKNLTSVVERLLNESATAYIDSESIEVVADSKEVKNIEIRVIDEAQRNVIARLHVKIAFKCLLLKEFRFY